MKNIWLFQGLKKKSMLLPPTHSATQRLARQTTAGTLPPEFTMSLPVLMSSFLLLDAFFSPQSLSLSMCCPGSLSHTLYVGRWHIAEHLSASRSPLIGGTRLGRCHDDRFDCEFLLFQCYMILICGTGTRVWTEVGVWSGMRSTHGGYCYCISSNKGIYWKMNIIAHWSHLKTHKCIRRSLIGWLSTHSRQFNRSIQYKIKRKSMKRK